MLGRDSHGSHGPQPWRYPAPVLRRPRRGTHPQAFSISVPVWGITLALVLGAAVRLALMPLTYGHDFVVWDDATRLLLHGLNPYTHWRAMPNAYPYLPVFLYLLLPLQWLALHTVVPFTSSASCRWPPRTWSSQPRST